MGKLIVIEGTDCSGKQTQSELLTKKLNQMGHSVVQMGFPMYDTPTGKIIAGSYLGKPQYGESFFTEGAPNVSGKVAGLYFAADRLYNLPKIEKQLSNGHVVLDRYVDSNIAHQAGKERNAKKRKQLYGWFSRLEYEFLKLPKPDIRILLYMPREFAAVLKQGRAEPADDHEKDEDYLKLSEKAYLEVAKTFKYKIINCVENGRIKSIEEINSELVDYVLKVLK